MDDSDQGRSGSLPPDEELSGEQPIQSTVKTSRPTGSTVEPAGSVARLQGKASNNKLDPYVGTVLADRYRILEIAGKGGMGVVYKAMHQMMDRQVAIKMLLPQLVADDVSVKRFEREARSASRINHPNIIALHDFGLTGDGQPYLVMDFLDGSSLADLIKKEGQLGASRCIHIFSQVCDALEHAHRQGVIHRDLKPGNIMLIDHQEDRDFVKVVDFGVAKLMSFSGEDAQRLTQTGELFGSPVYMSPEQCMGSDLDARSDIYGLGIVMYETLTGKLPLAGKNVVETIAKHMNSTAAPFNEVRPDLYIPERLEKVIFKCLQKDPSRRQQTMSELKEELLKAVPNPKNAVQLRSASSPAPNFYQRQAQKSPILSIAAVVLVSLAVGAAVAFTAFNATKNASAVTSPSTSPRQGAPRLEHQGNKATQAEKTVGSNRTEEGTSTVSLPETAGKIPGPGQAVHQALRSPPVLPAARKTAGHGAVLPAAVNANPGVKSYAPVRHYTADTNRIPDSGHAREISAPASPGRKHHRAHNFWDFQEHTEHHFDRPAQLPIDSNAPETNSSY